MTTFAYDPFSWYAYIGPISNDTTLDVKYEGDSAEFNSWKNLVDVPTANGNINRNYLMVSYDYYPANVSTADPGLPHGYYTTFMRDGAEYFVSRGTSSVRITDCAIFA